MPHGLSSKVISACFGLGAFVIAIIAGLSADNPFEDVVTRALVSMTLCAVVGMLIGTVAERTIRHAIDRYKVDPTTQPSANGSRTPPQTPGRPADL